MRPPATVSKALFILNPYAGIPPVKFIITKELDRRRNELACFKSLSVDESGALIKQNFNKYDIFIAAGGDGTVHTVASQLKGSGKVLGVLPIGSGNGFAKELGFRTNIRSLLKDIEKNQVIDVDIIDINGNLCLNVAGVGLDSIVAHSFDKLKTRGFWSYAGVTMTSFFRLKPIKITITIEGEPPFTEDLFDLTIANTRQFGYNAFIASDARPDDGRMDLVMIRPFPKMLFPVFVYRLFTGNLNKSKYVRYLSTCKNVTVRTDETRFHIDGEPVIFEEDVTARIRKDALKVLKAKHKKLN
jgi:diacylglycerol kinase family enzyme